ncbi:MAG: hypothetical protein ACRC0L_02210, partial [Angustibacter sp.]
WCSRIVAVAMLPALAITAWRDLTHLRWATRCVLLAYPAVIVMLLALLARSKGQSAPGTSVLAPRQEARDDS